MLRCILLIAVGILAPLGAEEPAWETLEVDGLGKVEYQVKVPKTSPEEGAPLLMLLPPGPGRRPEVEDMMDFVGREAAARGWVVVGCVAPGKLFFKGGEEALPPLAEAVSKRYAVDRRQWHLAGVSNGGSGALHAMIHQPALWKSVLAFPGGLTSEEDAKKLGALRGKGVTLYAGAKDGQGFDVSSRWISAELTRLGIDHVYHELKEQGHVLRVPEKELMADLERHRALASR